ncbi:cytochrome P450 [Colletotrichum higginsianum]|uniref:Cytochrome P450 n=1 Tax=Colletotrichum higginsianum (strain IMI 349063) TaxID=759273 RepID=H1VP34_COLHI|nr:cytochrome P450 [Colletotrichum higginsianum]
MGSLHEVEAFILLGLAHLSALNKLALGFTLLTLMLALTALLFTHSQFNNQKLVPNVFVVGGDDAQSIKANRERFRTQAKEMLEEGYNRTGGGFFYVPSPLGERLMIPTKYLEELKTAPIDHVDFVATFIEMFEGKYTTMGSRSTLHPRVVKGQLNHHLAEIMPAVQQEIRDAFCDVFPTCVDWTPIPVVDSLTRIVARVSSCMFGGTELSRNKEWVESSISFAIDGFIAAQKLKGYPEFLKPIVARFIPEIQKIAGHYAAAEAAAIPLLEARRRTGEAAADLLFWMEKQAINEEHDLKFLASILLKVSFAAIHTSAAAPAQLVYDLCERPEYIEPLREEIRSVADCDGFIDKSGFLGMTKMDSFMKESQRFNPLLLITFERVVHRPFTLSSGFTIPAHTTIGIPTQAITMDKLLYPSPETFDPFRFSKLRKEQPEMDGRAQISICGLPQVRVAQKAYAWKHSFFRIQWQQWNSEDGNDNERLGNYR